MKCNTFNHSKSFKLIDPRPCGFSPAMFDHSFCILWNSGPNCIQKLKRLVRSAIPPSHCWCAHMPKHGGVRTPSNYWWFINEENYHKEIQEATNTMYTYNYMHVGIHARLHSVIQQCICKTHMFAHTFTIIYVCACLQDWCISNPMIFDSWMIVPISEWWTYPWYP